MNNLFVIDTDQRFNKASIKLIMQTFNLYQVTTKPKPSMTIFYVFQTISENFQNNQQNKIKIKNKILKCFLALYKQCLRQSALISNTAVSWRNLFYSKLHLPGIGKNSLRGCSEETCSLRPWCHPADWASATGKSSAVRCNAGSGSFLK